MFKFKHFLFSSLLFSSLLFLFLALLSCLFRFQILWGCVWWVQGQGGHPSPFVEVPLWQSQKTVCHCPLLVGFIIKSSDIPFKLYFYSGEKYAGATLILSSILKIISSTVCLSYLCLFSSVYFGNDWLMHLSSTGIRNIRTYLLLEWDPVSNPQWGSINVYVNLIWNSF